MRCQRPDPLIQHVDDDAFRRGRPLPREGLHEDEWCAEVGSHVAVPTFGRGIPFVALEQAGVVDQHAERADQFRCMRKELGGSGFVRKVGLDGACLAAVCADGGGGVFGRLAAGVVVNGHGETGASQRIGDRPAEPLAGSGHESRAGD